MVAGMTAGLVAAAAVSGALLALAWRTGAPLEPLVATGRAILGGGAPALALVAGLCARMVDGVVWGLLLVVIAGDVRGWAGRLVAALAVSALAGALHGWLLPDLRLGFGLGVFPLHGPPLYYLYLLFAVALVAGMRIAR